MNIFFVVFKAQCLLDISGDTVELTKVSADVDNAPASVTADSADLERTLF